MNPRILLVEDDPTTRAFLAAAIEAYPARVDAVDRVSAARLRAQSQSHALWLIDAHLPDGDGASLLVELRDAGLAVPAIAHTAAREPALHHALLSAGFRAVLGKPLSTEALHAAIAEALDAGPPRRPAPRVADATGMDAPVWDDLAALGALNGQRTHVDALRALFLQELPLARDGVDAAVRGGDHAALRASLHRLQASCGFVGASRLGAAVRSLHAADDPGPLLPEFLAAAQATLAS